MSMSPSLSLFNFTEAFDDERLGLILFVSTDDGDEDEFRSEKLTFYNIRDTNVITFFAHTTVGYLCAVANVFPGTNLQARKGIGTEK